MEGVWFSTKVGSHSNDSFSSSKDLVLSLRFEVDESSLGLVSRFVR